ncbi:MAG: peptidase M28 family protein, partial [Sphingorhabdus sp.]
MKIYIVPVATALLAISQQSGAIPPPPPPTAAQLPVKDTLAFEITEGLTTEVGPRQAGTEAE